MLEWENRLAFRSTNRVVRPFDWGLEWTRNWPSAARLPQNGHAPQDYLGALDTPFDAQDEAFVSALVTTGHASTPGYNDPQYPIEGRPTRS